MATAQQTILSFMNILDTTSETGTDALDEAVRACSSFSSASDWIESFIDEFTDYADTNDRGYSSLNDLLEGLCGINLNDADTGAISGSDAGDATPKNAESIIPESGTATAPASSQTTISGLTVSWPVQSYDGGSLTAVENTIIADLNTWWIAGGLGLIAESYGLNFQETGTTVNSMQVEFTNENSSTLAATSWTYDRLTGAATSLTLSINMHYYNSLIASDPNGISTDASATYLDRVIAHELTHAVMAANIQDAAALPAFIEEGLAELVHGIDDERQGTILGLCTNPNSLASALDLTATSARGVDTYAAGYMALRYLAKYASTGTDAGTPIAPVYYNARRTTLTIAPNYSGTIWLGSPSGTTYTATATTINAAAADGTLVLIGNSQPNLIKTGTGTAAIWGGSSASDTLQSGSGSDTFWFGATDGSDHVLDYNNNNDILYFYDNSLDSIAAVGDDIRLGAGSSALTIDGKAGTAVNIKLADDTPLWHTWVGKNQTNTVAFSEAPANTYNLYWGAANYANTLQVTGSACIELNNTDGKNFYIGINTVDASAANGSVVLCGNAAVGNLLIGGQGTTAMWGGGKAADTLQGGSGTDIFWFGCGDGQDTITNGQAADNVYFYSADMTFTSIARKNDNLVFNTNSSDSLTITNWSVNALNTFTFANGSQYRLTDDSNGKIGCTQVK